MKKPKPCKICPLPAIEYKTKNREAPQWNSYAVFCSKEHREISDQMYTGETIEDYHKRKSEKRARIVSLKGLHLRNETQKSTKNVDNVLSVS